MRPTRTTSFRFSPASIRLTSNGVSYMPIGTLEDNGLLRNNKPDDFLFIDLNSGAPIDLAFFVDRSDVFDTAGKTTKFQDGAFLAVKRMAFADLSDVPISDRWSQTVRRRLSQTGIARSEQPVILPGGGVLLPGDASGSARGRYPKTPLRRLQLRKHPLRCRMDLPPV